jgi:hypothetical protein
MRGFVSALLSTLLATASASGASLCFGPASSGNNATVDCNLINPTEWAFTGYGFSDDPNEPCTQCPDECWDDIIGEGCIMCAYLWSLSASDTDPRVNVAPVPADGWLYLWLYATYYDGAAAFGFQPTGSLVPVEFELLTEGVWLEDEFPVIMAGIGGCPDGPTLIGRIRVQDPSPVESRTWGRTKAAYR